MFEAISSALAACASLDGDLYGFIAERAGAEVSLQATDPVISDVQAEFMARDNQSFMRAWGPFDMQLTNAGYLAAGGQIVDFESHGAPLI